MVDATKKPDIDVEDLVAQTDTGARNPAGFLGKLIAAIAFVWSVFQLYIASNLPYTLTETLGVNVIVGNTEARAIHLSFALLLAALAYPLFKTSPRRSIPWYDWLLAALGIAACMYLLVFKNDIADRAGAFEPQDLVVATVGMIVLGIAVYRSLGLPLVVVASVFVVYVFFGDRPFIPEVIQWRGASYGKAMWHYWIQSEGVFGAALGVSAGMIFLFVLFGALLDKAGAGNFFIKIAFAMVGHMRGGPAKAAVLSSAMTGLISGSSIANTVTTGTFTIPLMKRTGFTAEKAGAVEVASSTNGQLTPPVMGAAAFLMVEYVGISYLEVVRHAFLPAVISYIALVYIVHLEALKMGLKGMERQGPARSLLRKLTGFVGGFAIIAALSLVLYYLLGWTKGVFGDATFYAITVLFVVAYVVLAYVASRYPDLEMDDPNKEILVIPEAGATLKTGLFFLLPIVVLVWCLMVERLSPDLSAFWATMAMIFIVLTQHPLKAFFRGQDTFGQSARQGVREFVDGMIAGARNMIGIGVATGAAGIIVGTVSLTGAHQIMGEFVEFLSGGNLMLMLVFVAVLSLILGMGLPTTANYIVVSSLMAPVIVALGAKTGLIVPLIAVHMFVFYFGILADDTPPVGLAAFAAAAISGGDPIKTGVQGFTYDIRTAILPFLFLFNTELLLIDVTPLKAVFVFIVALIAMLVFAAATQGYMLVRNRIWESLILLLVAFTLFRPGYWMDKMVAPLEAVEPTRIVELAEAAPPEGNLRIRVEGETVDGKFISKTMLLPMGEAGTGAERLMHAGIEIREEDSKVLVDNVGFGSAAEKLGLDLDWQILAVEMKAEQPPKYLMYIPALALLVVVIFLQRRRHALATATAS